MAAVFLAKLSEVLLISGLKVHSALTKPWRVEVRQSIKYLSKALTSPSSFMAFFGTPISACSPNRQNRSSINILEFEGDLLFQLTHALTFPLGPVAAASGTAQAAPHLKVTGQLLKKRPCQGNC